MMTSNDNIFQQICMYIKKSNQFLSKKNIYHWRSQK